MKTFIRTAAAAALAAITALSAQAEEKVIRMGTMTWENMVPVAIVAKKALEDRGFTVEMTEFSEWGIAYAALSRGDIEVLPSQVDYVAADYWNKGKDRLEKISIASHGLFQAFAVPSYVNIDSIEEMNANADMLGGKIIGIEPGAGLMRESAEAIEAYGIDMPLIEGSTAAMTAALKSAYDLKQPIVVTLWTPTWMAEKFDMKFLADPKGIFSPYQSLHMIAQKGFSERHPEAREIIAGVFLPNDDIAAITTAVVEGATLDEATQAWIDSHGDLMARWGNIRDY